MTDPDGNADWNGGTLQAQITANAESGDRLSISDSDGAGPSITVSGTNILSNGIDIGDLSASGGVVTGGTNLTIAFDADATNVNVQEVLQSIRYNSTSDNPGTSDRTITFTATDNGDNSSNDSRTVSVIAVNDEPTLTATGSNPTFTEGGAAASLFSGTSVSTIEAGQTINGLTFNVSNVSDGSNERMNVDGSTIVLTNGTSGTTATNSLSYSVSVAGNTATVSLAGGTLSEAAAQTLVNNISYQNNSNAPDTSDRVVTLTSVQDSGGNANGDDTAALAVVSTVTVAGINDEPTLTSTGSNPTFTEGGAAASLFSGSSVSAVEAGQTLNALTLTVTNVNDDTDEILNADGTAIVLTNGTSGTTASNSLSYSVSVSGTTATVSLSGGTLSSAATQTLIDSLSYQNNSNTPDTSNRAITITSLQDSGGGDDTASLAVVSTVSITGVNNEPTLTASGSNPTFTEDDAAATLFSGTSIDTIEPGQTVSGLTFNVSGVTNGSNERINLDGSTIVLTNGTNGTTAGNGLSYAVSVVGNTATVSLSGGALSIAAAQTLVDNISYQNNSDTPDTANRTVTLTSLQDSGGDSNGGDDIVSVAIQSTLAVEAVNDEPTLTAAGSNPTYTEGGAAASLFSGSSVSTVEAGQTLNALTLTVTNVNDDTDEILNADGTAIVLTNGNSGTTASNSLSYIVSVTGTTATVSLSGGTLSSAATQTLIDSLSYQNNSNTPDTSNRAITITSLQDSGGGDDTASLAVSSTVTVAAVNNQPTLTATGTDPGFSEGATPVGLYSGANLSTVESSQTIAGFTLTVSGLAHGAEEALIADGSSVELTDGNAGTTVNNSVNYAVSITGPTATVSFTGASLSRSQAQSLIDSIAYSNTSAALSVSTRTVTLTSVTDSGGDVNGGEDTAALAIESTISLADDVDPVVSDANISVSGSSGNGGAYILGDVVTVTWDDTASGDNNSDVINGVTVDFSSLGGGASVAATNSSDTWSATYTIDGNSVSGSNLNVSVSATDNAGNTVTVADSSNAEVDNAAPIGHSVSFDDGTLNSTEAATASFTFASAEVGTDYSYTISSSGGGTAVTGSGPIANDGEQVSGIDLSGLSDGTLSLSAVLTDSAGNVAAAVTDTASLDTTAAQPTLTTTAGDPATAPFEVTVSFPEPVTGFTVGDITVSNATLGDFSGSGATYSVTITPTADGVVTVDVSAAVAKDTAGNDNTAAAQLSLQYDGSVPVPTISSGDAGSAVNGPVDVTLDFGEVVSGFVVGDITVTNASLGGFTDLGNGQFGVTVTGSGDGEVTLSVPAGVADDVAGNTNKASDPFTFTYDSSGPMLQSSTPGNGDTDVPYDSGLVLVFDEPVVADSGQLTLRDLTDGQDHSALSITDARVTVADKQITVALDKSLVPTHEYAVQVDADSLLDEAGNGWAGIQDDTTLRFTAGNLAPEAGNDNASLSQNTHLALDVLANDLDEEGRLTPASVRVITATAHGRAEVETATGAVTYRPEAGYTGDDSFTYVVEDEFGGESNAATVSLTVEPAGLPPETRGDTATVSPGGTVTLAILDNDSAGAAGVALNPESVELVLRPYNGTAEWANGELTYTADEDFEGVERLAYTVADADGVRSAATPLFINVSNVGIAPVARDDSVATPTATALSVEVLANDEASGSALASATVELGRLPGHGVAEVNPETGEILYTPDADFRGEDVFHYTVRDEQGLVSDTASVAVSVGLTGAPLARNDQVQVLGDAQLTINVLGNDRGLDRALDPTTLTLVSGTTQGTVILEAVAGLFRYTPDDTFNGSDTFTYTIRDEDGQLSAPATVTITDQPGNNRPLANPRYLAVAEDSDASISPLSNDQDLNGSLDPASLQVTQQPLNGTLTSGGDGTVSYTPEEDFYGEDRFTYTVADDTGRESELAVVRLVVAPVADKPLINGTPQNTVPAGTAYRFTPTATDIDGNPLTFSVTNLPAWASFDASNGRLQGTPDLEQVGASEPIVITASNGDEASSLPAFRIQVTDNAGGPDEGGDDPVTSPVEPGEDEASDRQLVDPSDPVLDAPASGWPSYTDEQPSRARYDIDYVDANGVPRNVSVILDDPSAPLPTTNSDGNGGQTLTFSQDDGSEQVVRIDPTGGAEVSSFRQGGDAEPGSRLVSQARNLVVTSLPQGSMRSEAVFGDEGPGQTRVTIIQSPTGEVTVTSVYTGADGSDHTTAVAFDPIPATLMLAADGAVTVTSGAVGINDVAAQEYRITPRGEASILSRRNGPSDGVLSSAIAVRSPGSTGVVEVDGYTMVDLPAGATSQVAEITAGGRVQYRDSGTPVDLAPGSAIALDSDGVRVVSRDADPDRNGLRRAAEVVSGAGASQNLARIEITDVESGNENLRVEEAGDGDGFDVSQTLPDGGGVLSSRIRLDGSSLHRLAGRSGQSDNEMTVRLPVNLSIRFADRVVAVAGSGDADMLAELLANGEVRHEVAINGESTRASSRIPGTRTVMEEGPDGSPQVTTRSSVDGRTMTVVADSQGRARHHLVNRAGTQSSAQFNAPGASTTIDEDGTLRARSRLGDGDRCAWVETFGNGETGTGFGYYDSDAVRCIGIDAPTSLESLFEPGAKATVEDDESGASITVETPLTRPLRF
ncbi:Ig-like domain-containing protein [Marinobacter lacisalsi]|uniref:Ig-like domain-containing protein n=1 Tax=Marinobacter lacisalsi TaxID=475979 RepID=A0ABV8QFS8_9GAMM